MNEVRGPTTCVYDFPAAYEIRVHGQIKPSWSDRLEGMTISLEARPDGTTETTLVGELRDQAAVIGVLKTLYELHLPLLSVSRLHGE